MGRAALLLVLVLLFLPGCRQSSEKLVVVTQVINVEGEEVVVTRLVRQTIQVPVTPVVEEVTSAVALDISFRGSYSTLDPQLTIDDNSVDIIENLFVGLTRFNHATNQVEPALATGWEVSQNGRTWTFRLRDDIFWVRTEIDDESLLGGERQENIVAVRPVIAEDVVYAVRRACDPRIATPDVFVLFVIEGCEELNNMPPDEVTEDSLAIVGARAVGDTVLQIQLDQPAAHFLILSTMWPLRPVPAEQIAEFEEEWDSPENLVTSGPFTISPSTLPSKRTVLKRNPFWPAPFSGNIDVVNILHLDDDTDAFLLWQDRNLDLSPVPAAEQTTILNQHEGKAALLPTQTVFYLAYNFESPVVGIAEVRRALGAAIDRERLIREVHGDRAVPMRHFAPPGTFGAPPINEVGNGYSPDYARQQIQASGFTDCRLMPTITYMVSSSDLALQQAELLREMWVDELGCNEDQFVIEQVQFGTLLANTRPDAGAQRPDIWDLGWAAYYPDENNWMGDVIHCQDGENRQKRPCGQVDDLIRNAGDEQDQSQRFELYRQIERLLFGDSGVEPITPLYARGVYVLRQPWLTYTPALFGGEQYDTYLIDAEVKELEQAR